MFPPKLVISPPRDAPPPPPDPPAPSYSHIPISGPFTSNGAGGAVEVDDAIAAAHGIVVSILLSADDAAALATLVGATLPIISGYRYQGRWILVEVT